MPAGVHAADTAPGSDAQLRREAAKAQLEAEASAETPQVESAAAFGHEHGEPGRESQESARSDEGEGVGAAA